MQRRCIFLSDQDDVWEPSKISTLTSKFIEDSNIHDIINDVEYANENIKLSGATVLQHIVNLGDGENARVQELCTAIT